MIGGTEITVTENVSTALRDFGPRFRRGAAGEMNRFGQEWVSELVSKRLSGRPGVNRRTGNLARSFKSKVTDSVLLNAVVLDVQPEGPGAEYADLQEFGGVVKPKRSKYLWIPIAGNLTPEGVARITPTEAINRGGFFAKGVFFGRPVVRKRTAQQTRHIGGSGYKGASFQRNERIEPLFVLKKSVNVPGRMGATALWNQSTPRLVQRLDDVASAMIGAI